MRRNLLYVDLVLYSAIMCLTVGCTLRESDDVKYTVFDDVGCYLKPFYLEPCADGFVRRLLACEPVSGGYDWDRGSIYLRVRGRQGGDCIIDIGDEGEGGVIYYRCKAPLPVQSWKGLQWDGQKMTQPPQITDGLDCVVVERCNLFVDVQQPCSSEVPVCPDRPAACSR